MTGCCCIKNSRPHTFLSSLLGPLAIERFLASNQLLPSCERLRSRRENMIDIFTLFQYFLIHRWLKDLGSPWTGPHLWNDQRLCWPYVTYISPEIQRKILQGKTSPLTAPQQNGSSTTQKKRFGALQYRREFILRTSKFWAATQS